MVTAETASVDHHAAPVAKGHRDAPVVVVVTVATTIPGVVMPAAIRRNNRIEATAWAIATSSLPPGQVSSKEERLGAVVVPFRNWCEFSFN